MTAARATPARASPHPDTFLAAAEQLGVDAGAGGGVRGRLAGVEAGRAGGFGFVVGVDRVGQAEELRAHGADIVVADLSSSTLATLATASCYRSRGAT